MSCQCLRVLSFFPVATAQDLRDLLEAVAASPPEAPKPTKLEQFVGSHPTVAASAATATTPASYADEQYQGLNAFVLVNKVGERQAVRFVIVPDHVVHITPVDAAKRDPDFLAAELSDRLKRGPVNFSLKAQLAAPGDPTADPSRPWPDGSQTCGTRGFYPEHRGAGQHGGTEEAVVSPRPGAGWNRALRRLDGHRADWRVRRVVLASEPVSSGRRTATCFSPRVHGAQHHCTLTSPGENGK